MTTRESVQVDGGAMVNSIRFPLRTIVATDDSTAAASAVRLAGALTAAGRITPILVGVSEMLPLVVGSSMSGVTGWTRQRLERDSEEERQRTLRGQAAAAWPNANDWPVRLAAGDAATEIDAVAVAEQAGLVIMGLTRHGRIARAFGLETTVDVVRRDHASVLAVVPGYEQLPLCIVVGTDFGQASRRAAQLAAGLLAPGGRLVLVYAEPMLNYNAEDREGYGVVHGEGIRGAFEQMRACLELPPGGTVENREIDATPTHALLDIVRRERAELLAVGRQHHSAVSHALLGSVTTDLLRDAGCSVLVTPVVPWHPGGALGARRE